MAVPRNPWITNFLKWRYKHISNVRFIYILSILVGLLAGVIAVVLKNLTYLISETLSRPFLRAQDLGWYIFLPFFGLGLVAVYVHFVHRKPLDHAVSSILFSLSRKRGRLGIKDFYTPLVVVPLTVGFGGSVGLLGSAIASGSALSSVIARSLHVDVKNRSLLIACASAGAISSIFQSPIAAVVFAVEVFKLDLTMKKLIPLLLASVAGVLTSYFFLGNDVLFATRLIDGFELEQTPFYLLLGIVTGLASIYFTKMYFWIQNESFRLLPSKWMRWVFGGLFIGALIYAFPPLYGEGFGFINTLLTGDASRALENILIPFDREQLGIVALILLVIALFKAVAMSATFSAGGSGGIIIPTLVMGSALGHALALGINRLGLSTRLTESHFTLVGMAGLIAGVMHAPLTAIFLIAEITGGYTLFVPLMITASISLMISRGGLDYTIYTKELKAKGALLTDDKDHNVLTLMRMEDVIESNFSSVSPDYTLGEMLHSSVAKSSRNIFPVLDKEGALMGIVLLDDIRELMFKHELYNKVRVSSLMHAPPEHIFFGQDSMKEVMKKFQDSGAWNLPVIRDGKYIGFISKSKLLTAYRRKLIYHTP